MASDLKDAAPVATQELKNEQELAVALDELLNLAQRYWNTCIANDRKRKVYLAPSIEQNYEKSFFSNSFLPVFEEDTKEAGEKRMYYNDKVEDFVVFMAILKFIEQGGPQGSVAGGGVVPQTEFPLAARRKAGRLYAAAFTVWQQDISGYSVPILTWYSAPVASARVGMNMSVRQDAELQREGSWNHRSLHEHLIFRYVSIMNGMSLPVQDHLVAAFDKAVNAADDRAAAVVRRILIPMMGHIWQGCQDTKMGIEPFQSQFGRTLRGLSDWTKTALFKPRGGGGGPGPGPAGGGTGGGEWTKWT